jgi:hypothetical protein
VKFFPERRRTEQNLSTRIQSTENQIIWKFEFEVESQNCFLSFFFFPKVEIFVSFSEVKSSLDFHQFAA